MSFLSDDHIGAIHILRSGSISDSSSPSHSYLASYIRQILGLTEIISCDESLYQNLVINHCCFLSFHFATVSIL